MKRVFLLITMLCAVMFSISGNDFNKNFVNRADKILDMRSDTNYCKVDSIKGVINKEYKEALNQCVSKKDSVWLMNNYVFLLDQIKQTKQEIDKRNLAVR